MAFFNTVTLIGNLTRDPELKNLNGDRVVAQFGLAVNKRWRGADGEPREEAMFIDIEAWGRTAELASQYLTKGSSCLIHGSLKLDTWEDKDGSKRSRHRIVANQIQFMDRRGPASAGADDEASPAIAATGPAAPAARGQRRAAVPAGVDLSDEPPF